MTKATNETLYRIVDEYPYLEREDEYSGLTLTEAAIRMDDLTGCGEDVILSDWDEPCPNCDEGTITETLTEREADGTPYPVPSPAPCPTCNATGKWPGPWEWSDDETNRTVTMMREVS